MRMLWGLSLIMLALASGCGLFPDYRYEQALEQWKGQPIDVALQRLGQPTSQQSNRYAWRYYQEVEHGATWVYEQRPVLTTDRYGRRVISHYVYVPRYQGPWTEIRNCDTIIYVNRHNQISNFKFYGSYCGQWFENVVAPPPPNK